MSAQSAASSSVLYRNVHYPSYSPLPECRVSISTSFSLSLRSLRLASLSSTAGCTWIVYSRSTCVATRPCRTRIPMLLFSPGRVKRARGQGSTRRPEARNGVRVGISRRAYSLHTLEARCVEHPPRIHHESIDPACLPGDSGVPFSA